MRDDRERLLDIVGAIDEIERLIGAKSFEQFRNDADRLPAVYFYLIVIGEAASALSDDFRSRHTETPWARISAMRNFLVHTYHRIDPEIVWKTATVDLRELRSRIEQILESP